MYLTPELHLLGVSSDPRGGVATPWQCQGYTMTEAAEPDPGLHGQHLLGAILSVKTDRQEGLKGGRGSCGLWGPGAARGEGVGAGACHPHVLHILWQCAQA